MSDNDRVLYPPLPYSGLGWWSNTTTTYMEGVAFQTNLARLSAFLWSVFPSQFLLQVSWVGLKNKYIFCCSRLILVEYEDSKVVYELFCVYCKKYSERIPITFLLGFYVTQVSNSRITKYDNLYAVSGCNLQFSLTVTRIRTQATLCFVLRIWTQHGKHWL